ncbi:hypothetical protein BE11_01185 [Sorangium cellulosum]|nr:hypothetical protein BE11_01185 [Sorangium cellulosum]
MGCSLAPTKTRRWSGASEQVSIPSFRSRDSSGASMTSPLPACTIAALSPSGDTAMSTASSPTPMPPTPCLDRGGLDGWASSGSGRMRVTAVWSKRRSQFLE